MLPELELQSAKHFSMNHPSSFGVLTASQLPREQFHVYNEKFL